MKLRPVIYLAGAITPTGRLDNPVMEYLDNISRFIEYDILLREAGFAPFNPALDLLVFLSRRPKEKNDIYEISISMMLKCDAIFLLPGWENSAGTRNELEIAQNKYFPIFTDLDELKTYFGGIK